MADRKLGRIGEQIGPYQLTHLLGAGGFGEVYEAIHPRRGQVALKLLKRELDEQGLRDFLNDVRVVLLRHPHIIEIVDFGVEGQTPYLAMSYCAAGSLRGRPPRGVRLPLPTIVGYTKQIAEALQYAHDNGTIHRDVKPDNVLVGPDGTLALADFGTALLFDAGKTHQTVERSIGSPEYAAPEQFLHKPGPASDQYALGTMVYEWLSGDVPFHASSWTAMGMKKTQEPPPRLVGITPPVEQVVLRALAIDPQARFASVQAFATALERTAMLSLTTQGGTTGGHAAPPITAAPPTPDQPKAAAAVCEIDHCGFLAVGRCASCKRAFCSTHQAYHPLLGWDNIPVAYVNMCISCAQISAGAERSRREGPAANLAQSYAERTIAAWRRDTNSGSAQDFFRSGAARTALLAANVQTVEICKIDRRLETKKNWFYIEPSNRFVDVVTPIGHGWILGEFTWKRPHAGQYGVDIVANYLTALLDVPPYDELREDTSWTLHALREDTSWNPDKLRSEAYADLLSHWSYNATLVHVEPYLGGYMYSGYGRHEEFQQDWVGVLQAVKQLIGETG